MQSLSCKSDGQLIQRPLHPERHGLAAMTRRDVDLNHVSVAESLGTILTLVHHPLLVLRRQPGFVGRHWFAVGVNNEVLWISSEMNLTHGFSFLLRDVTYWKFSLLSLTRDIRI